MQERVVEKITPTYVKALAMGQRLNKGQTMTEYALLISAAVGDTGRNFERLDRQILATGRKRERSSLFQKRNNVRVDVSKTQLSGTEP
jgi:hypothetical protein